eukprot:353939-Chlamydomonas_euryale.AAC.27
MLQLWTVQPPTVEWIRRGQPAHSPPQRPPGAEGKGRPRLCPWVQMEHQMAHKSPWTSHRRRGGHATCSGAQ